MVGDRVSDDRPPCDVWAELLDQFESVVTDHAARLDALDELSLDRLPEFVAPATVPPVPAELRPRALELVRRNDELAARVMSAAARIEPVEQRVRGPRTSTAPRGFDELA